MTITEILKSEASATEKLSQLAEIVTAVRAAYGNTEAEVETPYIPTPDGMVDLKYLDADSKLALVERTVKAATIEAVETCEANSALVFDREIERLIAADAIMCNLLTSTGSKYI